MQHLCFDRSTSRNQKKQKKPTSCSTTSTERCASLTDIKQQRSISPMSPARAFFRIVHLLWVSIWVFIIFQPHLSVSSFPDHCKYFLHSPPHIINSIPPARVHSISALYLHHTSFLPTSLVAQMVKCLPETWETRVRYLHREDTLEKEMATHSSTLAWKIPWTEEPGRLQSTELQRVGHN